MIQTQNNQSDCIAIVRWLLVNSALEALLGKRLESQLNASLGWERYLLSLLRGLERTRRESNRGDVSFILIGILRYYSVEGNESRGNKLSGMQISQGSDKAIALEIEKVAQIRSRSCAILFI
jgi:hypothetical protein